MRTRIALIGELTERDWDDWIALTMRAVEPNGWLDPAMLRPAVAWPEMSRDLRVAITEDDHHVRAVMAFTVQRQRRLPVTLLSTEGRFMTWHADRHHPLIDESCVDDALAALLSGLAGSGLGSLIDVSLFPADGPLADSLARLSESGEIGVSVLGVTPSVLAVRAEVSPDASTEGAPGSLERMLRGASDLKTEHRRKLWSKARGLAAAVGSPLALEDWSNRSDVADRFIGLQGKGWKGDRERGGAGFSTDPSYERWFRDVLAAARHREALVALALVADERLLSLQLGIISGRVCCGFVDSYDEEFRSFGPGAISRVAGWRWILDAREVAAFDPALNNPRLENARLYPSTRDFQHVIIGAGSVRSIHLAKRWAAVTRIKERLMGAGT